MNHNLTVSKSILVNANADKVWDALTNPEIIKEYLYGTETVTNWKVGSPIIFQGEYDGKTYKDTGIILVNDPKTKLSYSYWSAFTGLEEKPKNYSNVTYLLKVINDNQTELSWIQKGFASEDAQKHSVTGMDAFLASIKAIIER
jgi:uncharacterized protein YndB with AHSA1/START domain